MDARTRMFIVALVLFVIAVAYYVNSKKSSETFDLSDESSKSSDLSDDEVELDDDDDLNDVYSGDDIEFIDE